jgi:hypothetical protein
VDRVIGSTPSNLGLAAFGVEGVDFPHSITRAPDALIGDGVAKVVYVPQAKTAAEVVVEIAFVKRLMSGRRGKSLLAVWMPSELKPQLASLRKRYADANTQLLEARQFEDPRNAVRLLMQHGRDPIVSLELLKGRNAAVPAALENALMKLAMAPEFRHVMFELVVLAALSEDAAALRCALSSLDRIPALRRLLAAAA